MVNRPQGSESVTWKVVSSAQGVLMLAAFGFIINMLSSVAELAHDSKAQIRALMSTIDALREINARQDRVQDRLETAVENLRKRIEGK